MTMAARVKRFGRSLARELRNRRTGRKQHGECAALAQRAFDRQPAAVPVDDVLGYRKARPVPPSWRRPLSAR